MQSFDELVQLVESVRADVAKCERGNKAAGTRVRGVMQKIKQAAQQVRADVLALRGAKEKAQPSGSCGCSESSPKPTT